jgi:hypothetical protein
MPRDSGVLLISQLGVGISHCIQWKFPVNEMEWKESFSSKFRFSLTV